MGPHLPTSRCRRVKRHHILHHSAETLVSIAGEWWSMNQPLDVCFHCLLASLDWEYNFPCRLLSAKMSLITVSSLRLIIPWKIVLLVKIFPATVSLFREFNFPYHP
ncbi:MAG: hypothetical protein NZ901_07360 [Geminocystis sp.]|nr:hypothetical protein [Geminocystis sp.]HIK36395.1 hypothetical protein [Geminocystis sp. M7585_C2015_104]MCS7147990.1 hypothetical protein [Geminocystis sp.]MCX8078965.1 hypothetical protein [Geminocystis sp.]MDW8116930.1 hypothetical protein [Geminocystis sp.]